MTDNVRGNCLFCLRNLIVYPKTKWPEIHADRKWTVGARNINYYRNKLFYNCEMVQNRHTKVQNETPSLSSHILM